MAYSAPVTKFFMHLAKRVNESADYFSSNSCGPNHQFFVHLSFAISRQEAKSVKRRYKPGAKLRLKNYALSHAGQKNCGCYYFLKLLISRKFISGDSQESARSCLIGHMLISDFSNQTLIQRPTKKSVA